MCNHKPHPPPSPEIYFFVLLNQSSAHKIESSLLLKKKMERIQEVKKVIGEDNFDSKNLKVLLVLIYYAEKLKDKDVKTCKGTLHTALLY